MKAKQHVTKIIDKISTVAKQYKDDIVGKTFLVLYEGQSIEVLFKTENFLHLCGVDTVLYAKDFYRKAVNGQLREKEIRFSNNHPYIFAEIKTERLSDALSLLKRDSLVITDVSTQTKVYKLGTTDLEVVLCFDSQLDDNGNPINDILIPYSLRVEHITNNKYNKIFEVDFVLSKKTGTKEYTKIEFGESSLLNEYLLTNNITQYIINIVPIKEDCHAN